MRKNMKRTIRAASAALLLTVALTGVASAHTAKSDCESITLSRAPASSTADVKVGNTVVLDDVAGNGTYAIGAGTYKVVWSDGYSVHNVKVNECQNPSATPTPTPTPSPTPSPTPTATPTAEPTPSATSSTPPSTAPSPSTTPYPSTEPTTVPTLPPTDTTAGSAVAAASNIALFALGALLAVITALVVSSYIGSRR